MKKAKDYIIFPLDVPSFSEAKEYIGLLANSVGMFKVGLELFLRAGHDIIRFINDSGNAKVFLDLKLHDIPATVKKAMVSITELNIALATVHCGEATAMLKAAVEGSHGKVGVLGVTVLTSVSSEDILSSGFKDEFSSDMTKLVMKRASSAQEAGCAGIVCSGLEVKMIKEAFGGDFITVTPGIRPDWDSVSTDDQKRITTPAQAVQNGSDYIVIGRPIRNAENPKLAADKIAKEIQAVIQKP